MLSLRDLNTKYNRVMDGGGLLICVFLLLVKKLYLYSQYRSMRSFQKSINWEFFCYKFLQLTLASNANQITPVFLQFLNEAGALITSIETPGNSFEQRLLAFFSTVKLSESNSFVPVRSMGGFPISTRSVWTVPANRNLNTKKLQSALLERFAHSRSVSGSSSTVSVVKLNVGGCTKTHNELSSLWYNKKSGEIFANPINLLSSPVLMNESHSSLASDNFMRYAFSRTIFKMNFIQPRKNDYTSFPSFSSWFSKQFSQPTLFTAKVKFSPSLRRRKLKRLQRMLQRVKFVLLLQTVNLPRAGSSSLINPTKRVSTIFNLVNWCRTISKKHLSAVKKNSALKLQPKLNIRSAQSHNFSRRFNLKSLGHRGFSTSTRGSSMCLEEFSVSSDLNSAQVSAPYIYEAQALGLQNVSKSLSRKVGLDVVGGQRQFLSRQYFYRKCALGLDWRRPFGISYLRSTFAGSSRILAPGVSRTLSSGLRTVRILNLAKILISSNVDCFNIRVNKYVGGELSEFANSFFRRRSVRWLPLKRRRIGFRRLRLFFFNFRRRVNWRKRTPNLAFKRRVNFKKPTGRTQGRFSVSTDINLAKRFKRRRIRYQMLSSFSLRELMFAKRRSPARTNYLRKCLHLIRISKRLFSRGIKTRRRVPTWFFWLKRRRFHFYWKLFRKRKAQKSRAVKLRVRRQLRVFKVMWRNWSVTKLKMSSASLFFNIAHKPTIVSSWYRRTLRRRRKRKMFAKRLRRLYKRVSTRLIASQWLRSNGFQRLSNSEDDRLDLYKNKFIPWASSRFRWTGLFYARGLLKFKLGKPKRGAIALRSAGAHIRTGGLSLTKINFF